MAIAAAQSSEFTKNSESSVLELAAKPSVEIIKSSQFRNRIDTLIFSSCGNEQYGAPILAEMLGIQPRICERIDNLCNSGTNAIVTAYALISSGLSDVALIVGAEKRDSPGSHLLWDLSRGSFNFPVHWAALFAKAHMAKYGTTEDQLAKVAVKNRANASKNPNALFKEKLTIDQVMSSKKIVDPLKLLDCSCPCEGSAAVLLVSDEIAKSLEQPVWIRGIGQQTNSASLANATRDLCSMEAASAAAQASYKMAKIQPEDIDVAEIHDAFSILEIIAMEDLGFVERGQGGQSINSTYAVINPRGGLLGCGHPIGASGIAQVVEIVSQLDGRVQSRQVPNCRFGLVHNLAAAGSSATVMIMGTG